MRLGIMNLTTTVSIMCLNAIPSILLLILASFTVVLCLITPSLKHTKIINNVTIKS
jgi:hypothetical protein